MFWCALLGATAALLLLAGGLGALQAATLMAALPFCFIMFLLIAGLFRQTSADLEGTSLFQPVPAVGERLRRLFVPATQDDIARQIAQNGAPALLSVRDALVKEGCAECRVDAADGAATLSVAFAPHRSFVYRLYARSRPLPAFTAVDGTEMRRNLTWTLAAQVEGDARARDMTDLTKDQIAYDVLEQLERWRPPLPA